MKLVVDRKAINQVVFAGKAVLANDQPIAPGLRPVVHRYRRPPARRGQGQGAAGRGRHKTLTVQLVNSPFAGGSDYAVAYQQLAGDAGIDVKILTESGSEYFAKDWLQVDFGLTSWGARPVPNALLNLLFRSNGVWNEGHYFNKKLDALIDAAGSELDAAKRKALYKQIEVQISDDGPSIIPFYSTFVFPFTTRLQGFKPNSDTFHYYKTAYLTS